MSSTASRWIGKEGAAFERVALAFEGLGFRAPRPDEGSGGAGAYALNIAAQYSADLSRREALAIINYALKNSREAIRNRWLSQREIIGQYGD